MPASKFAEPSKVFQTRVMWGRLSLLAAGLLFTVVRAEPTECQKCCSSGGDCSKAYKQTPGQCCGMMDGHAYCCPLATAKCWQCNTAYRCYSGMRPSPNVCVNSGGSAGAEPDWNLVPGRDYRNDPSTGSMGVILISVFFLTFAGATIAKSCQSRRASPLAAQQGIALAPVVYPQASVVQSKPGVPIQGESAIPVATGTVVGPAAQPVAGAVAGVGMYPGVHPGRSGYGGGTVAAGAGMGFLGGMMLGGMMSDHGGYGGGYGDGFDGSGGGDMGGDFAADM